MNEATQAAVQTLGEHTHKLVLVATDVVRRSLSAACPCFTPRFGKERA